MSRLDKWARQCGLRKRHTGFTLIELLVVVAIIALLAGLLVTAVTQARLNARKAKAQTEVRELIKAWKSYWLAYGQDYGWPNGFAGAKVEMTAANMRPLMVKDPTTNPRGLIFMEVKPSVLTDGFKDPWGKNYWVNFAQQTTITEQELYEGTVSFPNRLRYLYE